jgi:DNA-binding protein Fis
MTDKLRVDKTIRDFAIKDLRDLIPTQSVDRLCALVAEMTSYTTFLDGYDRYGLLVSLLERRLLSDEYDAHGGCITKLAKTLKINRGTMTKKLKIYGII